jgi:hypothetical protein
MQAGKRIPEKEKWNTFHHSVTVYPPKKACSVPEMRAPESGTFFRISPGIYNPFVFPVFSFSYLVAR